MHTRLDVCGASFTKDGNRKPEADSRIRDRRHIKWSVAKITKNQFWDGAEERPRQDLNLALNLRRVAYYPGYTTGASNGVKKRL